MTNKQALIITFAFFGIILIALFSVIAYAAPISNVLGNILPISDSLYDIGTSTDKFNRAFFNFGTSSALSVYDNITIGRTSTTTIYGNAATSTFSGGIILSAGCFRDLSGSCITSGVSTYLALTDTQASFGANRIIFTNSGATALTDDAGLVFETVGGGQLGIGLANPLTSFHIQAVDTDNPSIFIRDASANNIAQLGDLGIVTDNAGELALWDASAVQTVQLSGEGSSYFNSLNFGIGTTSPASRLSVHGTGYISSGLFVGGTLTATSSAVLSGGLTLTCTACLTDTNVADDITLTNITQITNRAITDLTGTLTVANGGTGNTTFTSSQLLYGNGSLALSSVATTSLTATSPLSLSQSISVIGSSASALSLSTTGDWTGTLDLIEGASFLRSDASDNYTSGTLTLDAGTSFVSNITGTSTWAGGLQTTAINATTGTSTFIGIQANCIKNALGGCITTEANRSILVASSTLAYNGAFGTAGTTTLVIANSVKATTLTNMFCKTDTGTAHIQFSDGTNKTDVLACVTGGTTDDGSIANNTWTSREDFDLEVGSSINAPNRITITIKLREE